MSVLPRIGDDVVLAVPQVEQVLARVDGMGHGVLLLELLQQPAQPIGRGTVFIEYINDEGIVRLHGRADSPGAGSPAADRWAGPRHVRFAHNGAVQLLQRRDAVRAVVALPMVAQEEGPQDRLAQRVQTAEISGSGLLVRDLPLPRPGETYRFELDLPGVVTPVSGRFVVERVDGAGRAQVRFTAITGTDRARLVQYAFELSRRQRRRAA